MTVTTGPLAKPGDAFEIHRAAQEHSQPDVPVMSREAFLAMLLNPWPGRAYERYLGYRDGTPVGYLEMAMPTADNLANVEVELMVHPSARRHGVGRALLDLAVERARARGRKNLIASSSHRRPDGAAFARAAGAIPGLEEVRSRLDVRTVGQARLDALLAEAWRHADGYRLMRWTGVPPDEIIDDVAYLDGRFNTDAPTGDLAVEPEKLDADRIRQGELNRSRRGSTSFNTGVLHGDRLVAFTVLAGRDAVPRHLWQNITLVDPPHRGHRLGLLIKIANLAYAREARPEVETIDTFNAAENDHMLRINREIGFTPVDSITEWQLTV
jgi:GNAT superfamily N-acetyltransferase/RimJ/RimL family protein N-acetyltransferase